MYSLDVTIDQVFRVDVLDPIEHLYAQLSDGLDLKFRFHQLKHLVQSVAQQVHDQNVVLLKICKVVDLRDALCFACDLKDYYDYERSSKIIWMIETNNPLNPSYLSYLELDRTCTQARAEAD